MPKSVEVVEKSTTLVPVVDARSPADPLTQDSVASIGMKEQATEPRVSGKQVNQANIVTPTKRPSGNLNDEASNDESQKKVTKRRTGPTIDINCLDLSSELKVKEVHRQLKGRSTEMPSDLRSILFEILYLYTVPVLTVFFKARTQLNFPSGNKSNGVYAIVDHLMKEVKTFDTITASKKLFNNNIIQDDSKDGETIYE